MLIVQQQTVSGRNIFKLLLARHLTYSNVLTAATISVVNWQVRVTSVRDRQQ